MSETIITDDKHHQRSDTRMVATAIKRGWNIPDSIMETLPSVMAGLVVRSDDERTKVNAAKVLVSMHGQNMRAEEGPRQGPTINVGVQVDARVEQRRAEIRQIAEGIRTRRLSQSPITG